MVIVLVIVLVLVSVCVGVDVAELGFFNRAPTITQPFAYSRQKVSYTPGKWLTHET
jgi:hypothetical protein